MISKSIAMQLKPGTVLYHAHYKNRDGSPLRARVNGQCKTWQRDTQAFRLPMKHGLRTCFYINEADAPQWRMTEEAARKASFSRLSR